MAPAAPRPRWRLPLLLLLLLALLGLGGWRVVRELRAAWHFRAARAALGRDDFEAARSHLAECLKAWPASAETRFLAARAARRGGALGAARRELAEAARLEWVPEALDLERSLLRAQLGDLAAVEKYLAACVLQGHPETELIVEVLTPAYLANYQVGHARACADRWIELRPDSARAWWYRGLALHRGRRMDEAIESLARAVELDAHRHEAQVMLARLLLDANRPAEAKEHLDELSRRRPGDPEVVVLAARCQDFLGRRQAARALLDRLLARHPDHAEALAERGRLELNSGRPRQAEPFLRQAAGRTPFDAELLSLLIRCLQQVGRAEEARQLEQRRVRVLDDMRRADLVTRAIVRNPADPELRRQAGEIYLNNGKPEDGLRWLASALRLKPDHRPTHRTLAEHFERTGQRERAEVHRALARGEQPGPDRLPPWWGPPSMAGEK